MYRKIRIFFFALVLTFGTTDIFARSALADSPIRIGIPLPLTGDGVQEFAQEIQRSFVTANELLGEGKFELVFEDDRCLPKEAVTIAQKLVNVDRVSIVSGGYCNSCLFSSAATYRKADIPVVTLATTGDQSGIGSKIFRIFPADHIGVDPLMEVISKRTKNLCIVSELDTYTELILRTIKTVSAKKYPEIKIFSEELNYPVSDYHPLFLKLAHHNCDGYFINTTGEGPLVTAIKQYLEIASPVQMYALYFPGSSFVRNELKEKLNNIIYSNLPHTSELANQSAKQFLELYEKKYGSRETSQPLKILTFEAFRLIVAATKSGKPLDQYIVRGKKITEGALRGYWFDEEGAIQGIPIRVFQYSDGKDSVLLERDGS